ncbi:MAG TPA: hypothetical protein VN643_26645 [Pyrinomonadaceae bacterium]|nr:hypothetical protein [Pyrinomonadaceae bacterium]
MIAKSIAETLLVAGLAVGFYVYAFPPTYHGWGEVLPDGIAGWAVNAGSQYERLEVQLFIDDKFIATSTANQSRKDIVSAGWARDEWHGYKFSLPLLSRGPHVARVYALHTADGKRQTLQLVGNPVSFAVDEHGSLIKPLSE